MDSEENGIQLQGVCVETVDRCTSVDAPVGGKAEAQLEFVESHVMLFQQVVHGVVFAGFDKHACRRKRTTQGGVVQFSVVNLFHQESDELVALLYQMVDGPLGA